MKVPLLKKRKTTFPSLAPLALAALLGACGKAPQTAAAPDATSRPLPIMIASAGAPLEYTAVGSVVSDQRVEVASRLSGHIRDILVQEGNRVRRGQLLARLDASDVDGGIR
jgi:multidrug efflux pump subunit AcrA (membrane-fusion protein)